MTFALGKISHMANFWQTWRRDLVGAATLEEIAESEGTLSLLFLRKFSFNVR